MDISTINVSVETDWLMIAATFTSTLLGVAISGCFSVWLFRFQYRKSKRIEAYQSLISRIGSAKMAVLLLAENPLASKSKALKTIALVNDVAVEHSLYIGKETMEKCRNMAIDGFKLLETDEIIELSSKLNELQNELFIRGKI